MLLLSEQGEYVHVLVFIWDSFSIFLVILVEVANCDGAVDSRFCSLGRNPDPPDFSGPVLVNLVSPAASGLGSWPTGPEPDLVSCHCCPSTPWF